MDKEEWNAFCTFRKEYKDYCSYLNQFADEFFPLQKEAADKDKVPPYPLENSVVYSLDYDRLSESDEIKLIVIGDNPGKDEQLNSNCRYLVGQSGKIAEGFFRKNPELEIDFRKNVLIMNKTPIHSAKTKELKFIAKNGGKKIASLIDESQIWMATKTAQLHQKIKNCQLWIVGYSELKDKQIFTDYRENFKAQYFKDEKDIEKQNAWQRVLVFQHFSMNRFLIDLKENYNQKINLQENLLALGQKHRQEIFGI